ncbi:hypothetical protein GCM10009733_056790 [Nonomuraea maheshkhaliensis]|uniref:Uncharacterized protein n=1 Tax=Nonomuraea maheshkhaliensis TaxID=419590 RepID=A0ABN2FMH8_9ACTN
MSGAQLIAVQHGQAVAGHVSDRVRMSVEVDDTGPAGVPMIEPDHLDPALDQPADERVGATDTLSGRPHDHQHGGTSGISDPFRPDPQRPGGHESLMRLQHGGTVAALYR